MNSTVENGEREMGDNTRSLNFCQASEKFILVWADILIIQRERDRETLKLFSYAAWSTPEIALDQ